MDGSCYEAAQFDTDNARANLGVYDYDSVVHHNATSFNENPGATLTVLKSDASGNYGMLANIPRRQFRAACSKARGPSGSARWRDGGRTLRSATP